MRGNMRKQGRKIMAVVLVMSLFLAGKEGMAAQKKTDNTKAPKLSMTKLSLKVGESKKLTVKNAKKKVKWSSSKKKVAVVSAKGVVKAKQEGTTNVIAKVGSKKLKCKVTVKKAESTVVPTQQPPAATASVTPTAAPSVAPTVAPTDTGDADWERAKQSGTAEDFEKYFNVTIGDYIKKKDVPQGSVEQISYYSEVIGEDREAYVYLPPEYSQDKTYPVMYLIHGIGCDGGQWISMYAEQIITNSIANGEVSPFVAVFPSVVPPAADATPNETLSASNIKAFADFQEEFTKDLEPFIRSNYSVSTKREETAVCGLSMGGMEALTLGFGIKDHFNYIGSFSAAPSLDTSLLTLDQCQYKPELVMLCTGTADGTVNNVPEGYHNVLAENGIDHIWYQYPKRGHEPKVWQNGLINFLRKVTF